MPPKVKCIRCFNYSHTASKCNIYEELIENCPDFKRNDKCKGCCNYSHMTSKCNIHKDFIEDCLDFNDKCKGCCNYSHMTSKCNIHKKLLVNCPNFKKIECKFRNVGKLSFSHCLSCVYLQNKCLIHEQLIENCPDFNNKCIKCANCIRNCNQNDIGIYCRIHDKFIKNCSDFLGYSEFVDKCNRCVNFIGSRHEENIGIDCYCYIQKGFRKDCSNFEYFTFINRCYKCINYKYTHCDIHRRFIKRCSDVNLICSQCTYFVSAFNPCSNFKIYSELGIFTRYYCDYFKKAESLWSQALSDESQMVFTHGRLMLCPYCGSEKVDIYNDGTAQCIDCSGWYRYAYE